MLATPGVVTNPLALINRATVAQIQHYQLAPWVNAVEGTAMLACVIKRNPPVNRMVATALAVQAASTLQLALESLRVTEQCGRVYLTAFEPRERAHRDPELPMVLFDLGRVYADALRGLASHLLEYRDFSDNTYARRWWVAAEKRVHKCLQALEAVANRLTILELCYMVLMLQAPLAWPRGHHEVAPGSIRREWETI